MYGPASRGDEYDHRRGRGHDFHGGRGKYQGGGDRYYDRGRDRRQEYEGGRPHSNMDRSRERYNRGQDPTRDGWVQNGLPVVANLFRMEFLTKGVVTYYRYYIQIHQAFRKKDDDGKFVLDSHGKQVWEIGKSIFDERDPDSLSEQDRVAQEKRNRSSHISRRVINKVQHEYKITFLSDGTNMAVSTEKMKGLTTQPDDRSARRKKNSRAGIYGPADSGDSGVAEEQLVKIKPYVILDPVRVRKDTDEEDEEAKKNQYQWFQVKLTLVDEYKFGVDHSGKKLTEPDKGMICTQSIQLAISNAMASGGRLLALTRSPRMFFFKDNMLGNTGVKPLGFDPRCMPLTGLLQTARLSSDGSVFLSADMGLGWHKVEETYGRDGMARPVPLLHVNDGRRGGEVAGVKIDDFSVSIPVDKRNDIQKALEAETFHVMYTKGLKWQSKMMMRPLKKFEGKSPDEIKRLVKKWAKVKFNNKRMEKEKTKRSPEGREELQPNIIWAADDPSLYEFALTEHDHNGNEKERRCTVAEYYDMRHDVQLRYPKMPLVRVSFTEYFPLEFLYQALGPAPKGNSDRKLQHALNVNDVFACNDRIHKTQALMNHESIMPFLESKLQALNLRLDARPMQLQAKVLKMPNLVSANKRMEIINGSWNLKDVEFAKPAKLYSFGVINLCNRFPGNLPSEIFDSLEKHGIQLPLSRNLYGKVWNELSVKPRGNGLNEQSGEMNPNELQEAFSRAKNNAKRVFIGGAHHLGLCFLTVGRPDTFNVRELAVLPPSLVSKNSKIEEGHYAMCVDRFGQLPSHIVRGRDGQFEATLHYKVEVKDHKAELKDRVVVVLPHLIKFSGHGRDVKVFVEGHWRNDVVHFLPLFKEQNGHRVWSPEELASFEPAILDSDSDFTTWNVKEEDIECPSLIYVLIPKKLTSVYNLSKFLAFHSSIGCNTQTITMEAFMRQKNPAQYCSNIALKTNTKLGCAADRACAWIWSDKYEDGALDEEKEWLREAPTMIAGLATASAQGQGTGMVVVGTSYNDVLEGGQQCCYEARAQTHKSPIIHGDAIKGIFKNLMVQFIRGGGNGQVPPKRIIVIRSGGHDGTFGDIRNEEVSSIREAYIELHMEKDELEKWWCKCEGKGCQLCCPLITFIVAQTSHNNIRLAPRYPKQLQSLARKTPLSRVNVPSGTVVDSAELLLPSDSATAMQKEIREGGIPQSEDLTLFAAPGSTTSENQDFFLISHGGLKGTSNGVHYRVIWNENLYFCNCSRSDSPTTPLTASKLQRLMFALSFIYGKATKAPRDSALVRTASQLANTLLGVLSSLHGLGMLRRRDGENSGDPDSAPELFVLEDGSESLLASFGPYQTFRDESGEIFSDLSEPFRPHLVS